MNNRWSRGALAMGIVGAALLGVGCGGERQPETLSAEVIASTALANLNIEGMT